MALLPLAFLRSFLLRLALPFCAMVESRGFQSSLVGVARRCGPMWYAESALGGSS